MGKNKGQLGGVKNGEGEKYIFWVGGEGKFTVSPAKLNFKHLIVK
jgi:hypothetical protein